MKGSEETEHLYTLVITESLFGYGISSRIFFPLSDISFKIIRSSTGQAIQVRTEKKGDYAASQGRRPPFPDFQFTPRNR